MVPSLLKAIPPIEPIEDDTEVYPKKDAVVTSFATGRKNSCTFSFASATNNFLPSGEKVIPHTLVLVR